MARTVLRIMLICFLAVSLSACVVKKTSGNISLKSESELEQGKRYFEDGYYKKAMTMLLPLACNGVAEAQYAVGYMYYYGYGVAQDTDVGYFWIRRSAEGGYKPAQKALESMHNEKGGRGSFSDRYKMR